jgi:CIC family chloride channel protein
MTLGIGGSGGVFAPSLFIGVTSGMAFGEIAGHVFGPAAGQPALYAVVAMGAVFTSAARAPLTSLASVVELTGDFTLTLPVMLAVAIATIVSRMLSYGTIYTTKLLRRGIDVDRAAPWRAFGDMKVREAMQPLGTPLPVPEDQPGEGDGLGPGPALPGPVTHQCDPQILFSNESVAQALRQLDVYGHDGLPVLSPDGQHIQGWVTGASVLRAIARQIDASGQQAPQTQLAAEWALADPESALREPPTPLPGYQILEITIPEGSSAAGQPLGAITWPPGWIPVSMARDSQPGSPNPERLLRAGDRINLLAPPSP